MTHDRREHTGTYYATLVEVSSGGVPGYPAGTPLEDVLRGLHELVSHAETTEIVVGGFKGDAYISLPPYVLSASASSAWTLYSSNLIGGDNDVSVDPDTFADPEVSDPNDPEEIADWSDDGTDYLTAWMKFVVDDGPRRMRIHMGNSGADDTVMFMWQQESAPTGTDTPFHLSDDGIDGTYLPAFTNAPCVDAGGTHYDDGGAYADDDWEFGIELENGTYWIACFNYSYTDWRDYGKGTYVITFQPLGVITGDAVIANGIFTGDAFIST